MGTGGNLIQIIDLPQSIFEFQYIMFSQQSYNDINFNIHYIGQFHSNLTRALIINLQT